MRGLVKYDPAPLHTQLLQAGGHASMPWAMWFQSLSRIPRVLNGTHAQRLQADPKTIPTGSTWFETDRGVTYLVYYDSVANEQRWYYERGTMPGTLSPDQKPTDLGTDDEGFQFWATDFQHTYVWDGSAWAYAPGDSGSGFIQWDTAAPTAGVWQLCDGTATTRSTAAGGSAAFTTPNLVGRYPKGGSAYTGAAVTPAAVSITGQTGDEDAHTHPISADPGPDITDANPVGQEVQSGTGIVVAPHPHAHTYDPAPIPGSSGAGSPHHHDAGTLALSGSIDVPHVVLLPYFRR